MTSPEDLLSYIKAILDDKTLEVIWGISIHFRKYKDWDDKTKAERILFVTQNTHLKWRIQPYAFEDTWVEWKKHNSKKCSKKQIAKYFWNASRDAL